MSCPPINDELVNAAIIWIEDFIEIIKDLCNLIVQALFLGFDMLDPKLFSMLEEAFGPRGVSSTKCLHLLLPTK